MSLLDRLRHSLDRIKRNPSRLFAVLFIDLDRFKVVNEGLSHVVGDKILKEVGRRLQRCVRVVDTVARFGADEFVILLDEIGAPMDVLYVVERIRKELLQTVNIVGYDTVTSASIGIVVGAPLYVRAEDIVRDAEIAMGRARTHGPGRYAIFDAKMQEMAANRLSLELDLQKAIEKNQFQIHYQPIVHLRTGKITGFEALIRWHHPRRGLLQPSEFLPVAEETNLIVPLSFGILREACSQVSRWQAKGLLKGHLGVSVNLPSKVLEDPSLSGHIASLLSSCMLDPCNLTLEVTENQVMDNPESVSDVLTTLNTAGVRIAIECQRNSAVVRAILSLGESLGLDVVAEGVERQEQLRLLVDLKCKYAQGYYFARPMELRAVEEFISRHIAGESLWAVACRTQSR